jgi:hypothetical protein
MVKGFGRSAQGSDRCREESQMRVLLIEDDVRFAEVVVWTSVGGLIPSMAVTGAAAVSTREFLS